MAASAGPADRSIKEFLHTPEARDIGFWEAVGNYASAVAKDIPRIARLAKAFFSDDQAYIIPSRTEEGAYHYPVEKLPWRKEDTLSSGCVVCIHGWRGVSRAFDSLIIAIRERDPRRHIVAPSLPEYGNLPLDSLTPPLMQVIEDYIERFPRREITIIGASYGGRIAVELTSRISETADRIRRISCITLAGVLGGTELMGIMKQIGIYPIIPIHPILADEFEFGSPRSRRLLEEQQNAVERFKASGVGVKFLCFGTQTDDRVFPIETTLLRGDDVETHVYQAESHNTIVPASQEKMLDWMFREAEEPHEGGAATGGGRIGAASDYP